MTGVPTAAERVRALTRTVADFPVDGVQFADLTPVLADADGLRLVIDELARDQRCDLVAAVDARGFLLGSGVALRLGTGVVAVRKAGKLPPPVHAQSYALEYGEATLELPGEGIELGGRCVLVVDDVLATGGTLAAAVALLRRCGAEVTGVGVVLEIPGLGGRDALAGLDVRCVVPAGTPA